VTQTPSPLGDDARPYPVVRAPGWRVLLDLVRWSDVALHNNVSLRAAWPLLLVRRPWVVVHQTWVKSGASPRGMLNRAKCAALRYATCVSISQAIADDFAQPSVVIPNPYDDETFLARPDIPRDRAVVFVGRLVSTKGVPDLLAALARLGTAGLRPDLTVVGSGPEEGALRRQAEALCIAEQVTFAGPLRGEALARCLARHRVLCVPSRWNEPFGVVALEGMACGCIVVGSRGGGLKDAIGPGGSTFPNGDVAALANCLTAALSHEGADAINRRAVEQHLAAHRPQAIADAYLDILHEAIHGR
jgi:glycogen(starch) synthase